MNFSGILPHVVCATGSVDSHHLSIRLKYQFLHVKATICEL